MNRARSLLSSLSLGAFALASLVSSAPLAGCGAEPRVVRVYDGRIVLGRYVSPDAYAAFMRGALAEEGGDLKGALTAYAMVAENDDDDPEVFTRIGEVRCKLDPKDGVADRAFERALKLDPTYAGTLAAKARCSLARGRTEEAADFARRAAAQDPTNVEIGALVVRADAGRPDPASRERAIALTLAHGENAAAWDALIAWGRGHRDAELVARGLEGLVRAAPARSVELERGALALLAGGELLLARRVASAVADSPREMAVIGPRDATVARLAVDEALARGDSKTALARATRGHVSLPEVAARALLLDKKDIAATVAAFAGDADPGSSGAAMVKASLKDTNGKSPPREMGAHVTDQPPEICALVFADRLASAAGSDVARQWLARITRTPMPPRDPLAGPLALDLASRGVLPVADLPADLRASVQRAHAAE
ncbi:MAG: Tetratricopeptide 2 repeat protein [Labilithrix sp.]|nr:Tetratricopeptide 2 repeat protein [Labilithrix sp.]